MARFRMDKDRVAGLLPTQERRSRNGTGRTRPCGSRFNGDPAAAGQLPQVPFINELLLQLILPLILLLPLLFPHHTATPGGDVGGRF